MSWDDPGLDHRDSDRLWRAALLHRLDQIEKWLDRIYSVGVVATVVLIAILLKQCSA